MERRLEDSVVVITGASSGVGAACARLFVGRGARVVLAARGAAALEALCEELGGPTRALAVPTDVADAGACAALVERTVAAFGGLHVLVNNAGFNERGGLETIPAASATQMVDVNLRAPVLLCHLALPHLRRAGGGAIVNVASVAGMVPLPHEATYSATKAGLRAFSYALAQELSGSGVTVSAVSPGPIDTPFLMDVLDRVPDYIFSQPMSTAEEVAELVLRCALDGKVERVKPRLSGVMATVGYLHPRVPRLLRPLLDRKGARIKARYAGR